jgi:hypothetical protein
MGPERYGFQKGAQTRRTLMKDRVNFHRRKRETRTGSKTKKGNSQGTTSARWCYISELLQSLSFLPHQLRCRPAPRTLPFPQHNAQNMNKTQKKWECHKPKLLHAAVCFQSFSNRIGSFCAYLVVALHRESHASNNRTRAKHQLQIA